MEVVLIFVTLFAAVAPRNVPNSVYVPTKEQLELIFGDNPPKSQTVETPAAVPNESIFFSKNPTPPLKKTSNVLCRSVTSETVELNIKIKVNDCDKQNSGNDDPKVHTRFVDESDTDDRVSLGVKDCPSNQVRVGDICVLPD